MVSTIVTQCIYHILNPKVETLAMVEKQKHKTRKDDNRYNQNHCHPEERRNT
jgi:hypothetical protein